MNKNIPTVILTAWYLVGHIHSKPHSRLTSYSSRWNQIFNAFFSVDFQLLVFYVKTAFVNLPSIIGNDHWPCLKFKHLFMQKDQQDDPNIYINSLVPSTAHLRINHTLDLMVTVLLWCSNVKPMAFKGRSASFTAVNNLSGLNQPSISCILAKVDILCLKYELVWLWMIYICKI